MRSERRWWRYFTIGRARERTTEEQKSTVVLAPNADLGQHLAGYNRHTTACSKTEYEVPNGRHLTRCGDRAMTLKGSPLKP